GPPGAGWISLLHLPVPRALGKLAHRQLVEPFGNRGQSDGLIECVALLRHYLIAQHLAEEPIGRDNPGEFGQRKRRRCRLGSFPQPFINGGSSSVTATAHSPISPIGRRKPLECLDRPSNRGFVGGGRSGEHRRTSRGCSR